jgi:hypothetical protein
MPDTSARSNGNGREQFEGTIGGQQVRFVTRDLLPILLLLAVIVGGYLVHQQLAFAVRALGVQHVAIEDRLMENYKEFFRLLSVLDYNCHTDEAQHLPMVLDPALQKKRVHGGTLSEPKPE